MWIVGIVRCVEPFDSLPCSDEGSIRLGKGACAAPGGCQPAGLCATVDSLRIATALCTAAGAFAQPITCLPVRHHHPTETLRQRLFLSPRPAPQAKELGKQLKLGLVECLNHGLLQPYPVLHEKAGDVVAQVQSAGLAAALV